MSTQLTPTTTRQRARYIGEVKIYLPDSKGATRVKWVDSFGNAHDTKRATESEAIALAKEIDAQLKRGSGERGSMSIGESIDEYLSSPDGRNHKDITHGTDWTPGHHNQIRIRLRRASYFCRDVNSSDVTLELLDKMRAQGGTPRMVQQLTSALRGWLSWGRENYYLTSQQAMLLPRGIYMPGSLAPSTKKPRRSTGAPPIRNRREVQCEDAPSLIQVRDLGDELQRLYPHGRLAVELSAESGTRVCETLQLTIDDVDLEAAAIDILWQLHFVRASSPESRRVRPKHGITRTTFFPDLSQTGYDLSQALHSRVEQAKLERANGYNTEGLLFPHPASGDLFSYSEWKSDFVKPAALAAGWPYQEFDEQRLRLDTKIQKLVDQQRHVQQFDLVWHSLRHRFARTAVDVHKLTPAELCKIGGWSSVQTVVDNYYRPGEEHQAGAQEKFRNSRGNGHR